MCDSQQNARVCQVFEIKGNVRLRGLMNQERLLYYWATNLYFKNWLVANIINQASNNRSSIHTGDYISMGKHIYRIEKATGVKLSLEEVYTKCYTKMDKN
ncbi:hypothetical protein Ahy_A07g036700 [Arachis hypogaea]|uniref:Uncharacterized protein n=1 Tax=Arachis hypogaea TaxID=3818 RepID=A0A445CGR8_ARAHY|nr:hypothetical protein Ahy_A07g036700 [Arachis hypogaea]